MTYLKSALVGLAVVVIAAVLFPVLGIIFYNILMMRHSANTAVGWDVIPAVTARWPRMLFIAVLIFVAGFYWELRRLTK